ncbi:hypothetical protein [Streptomyces chromofuscus]|uniref:hypothetical protein n=1 Tax=Streptomyces chromofuscus TaxID=42881 RepID=UPI00167A25F7|nr:hypothetical protein [Streptomyces chromofuscus]GGT38587.1 hypothetical protein GCM10010254_68320 [Streptomyces chromofuscus]
MRVDLESRRPGDSLREAIGEGAMAGAPQAPQIAHRRHGWSELGDAAERAAARHCRYLRVPVPKHKEQADEATPSEEELDAQGMWERGEPAFGSNLAADFVCQQSMADIGGGDGAEAVAVGVLVAGTVSVKPHRD